MAIKAFGAILKIGSDTIGRIVSMGEFTMEREVIDTTTFESTNMWEENMAGFRKIGPQGFTIEYDSTPTTGEAAVLQTKLTGADETITIEPDDGAVTNSSYAASGRLTKLGVQFEGPKGKIMQNLEITYTGEPTRTERADA